MKTLLLSLVTGIAAFAAGWFLKPDHSAQASGGVIKPVAGAAADARAAKPVNPFLGAMKSSSGASGAAQIVPFRSVEEMLALMEELMDGGDLAQVELIAALPRLMATDIPAIKAMLEQLAGQKTGNHEIRGYAAVILAARWIMQEPENASGFLLARAGDFSKEDAGSGRMFDNEDMREGLTMAGILLSAKRNPAAAQALAQLVPKDDAEEIQGMLSQMEAMADPAKFLTNSTPEKLENLDDLTPLLARWARKDPAAAAKWAEAHGEEVDSDGVKAIATVWARTDRAAAMAWAAGREDKSERYNALVEIAGQAVEDLDQSGAESELAGFPAEVADTVRMDRLNDKGGGSADFLKAMAVKYAGDEEMSGRVAGHTVTAVRELMAGENGGAQAAAWIQNLPEGEPQASASVHLIDNWANQDPEAASAWVKALPAGDARERAAGQLVEEISREDPAGAIEWAKTLTVEESRREKMREVFESWLPKEPEQAMQVLQTLSEAERAAIFKSRD